MVVGPPVVDAVARVWDLSQIVGGVGGAGRQQLVDDSDFEVGQCAGGVGMVLIVSSTGRCKPSNEGALTSVMTCGISR